MECTFYNLPTDMGTTMSHKTIFLASKVQLLKSETLSSIIAGILEKGVILGRRPCLKGQGVQYSGMISHEALRSMAPNGAVYLNQNCLLLKGTTADRILSHKTAVVLLAALFFNRHARYFCLFLCISHFHEILLN